jgi:hypothetical protein
LVISDSAGRASWSQRDHRRFQRLDDLTTYATAGIGACSVQRDQWCSACCQCDEHVSDLNEGSVHCSRAQGRPDAQPSATLPPFVVCTRSRSRSIGESADLGASLRLQATGCRWSLVRWLRCLPPSAVLLVVRAWPSMRSPLWLAAARGPSHPCQNPCRAYTSLALWWPQRPNSR